MSWWKVFGRKIEGLRQKLVETSAANPVRRVTPNLVSDERENFARYRRGLRQQTGDKNKGYWLHAPQVYCLSKGKEHKKCELGGKAAVVMAKTHGVIVGAVAPAENLYAGDALRPALEQTRASTKQPPAKAIVDRGSRGRKIVEGTEVRLPGKPKPGQSQRESAKMRA